MLLGSNGSPVMSGLDHSGGSAKWPEDREPTPKEKMDRQESDGDKTPKLINTERNASQLRWLGGTIPTLN